MKTQSITTRIPAYDFVRAAACIGVFLFHADRAAAEWFPALPVPHLPEWTGFLFVTAFFMLSGSMMELRYGKADESFSLQTYYKKRWLSIFPAFYIVFLPLYLYASVKRRSMFFQGEQWTLILSLLGLDGYFSSAVKTYYMAGEWFLGALIMLYALYPLLGKLMKEAWYILFGGSVLLFLLTADQSMLAVSPLANMPSCLVSFVLGMCFERFVRGNVKRISISAAVTAVLLALTVIVQSDVMDQLLGHTIYISASIPLHLAGILIFQVLFVIGSTLKTEENLFTKASAYTYAFYLVHHVIIDRTLRFFSYGPDSISSVTAAGILAFVLSVFAAVIVDVLAKRITASFARLKNT